MNSFGSATKKFGLFDPRRVRESRQRFRRDSLHLLARANSLYVPTGRWHARGWILMLRSEYDQLDHYSTSLQLEVGDPRKSDNVGTIKNLSLVQAQCVTTGLSSDPNAVFLVEITDGRGILNNEWFSAPTSTFAYNVRAPAYPDTFHPQSMNGGTTWTWSTMLQSLWNQCTQLGTWPGLPQGVAPIGTPEGFWFPGVPVYTTLCEVLDFLGLTVACDLTKSSPFTIVSSGADDAVFSALQVKYATKLEDDQEWIDVGAGRVPKQVVVFFKRRNTFYGTEETVRLDNKQWDMTPYYSLTVSAPSTFSSAVGTHHLWSDFTVRYDQNGSPSSADVAQATLIAQERVTQYFDHIYSRTSGFMSQTYAGALPFTTGSQVDGVCWYQDHAEADLYDAGWRTKIVRGDKPAFDRIWTPVGM